MSPNDRNTNGYSIEDILEEARRIRRQSGDTLSSGTQEDKAVPKGCSEPKGRQEAPDEWKRPAKRNTEAHKQPSDKPTSADKFAAEGDLGKKAEAGTKHLKEPETSKAKSMQDVDGHIPDNIIKKTREKESEQQSQRKILPDGVKPVLPPYAKKSEKKDEDRPKTGIRRLDRFLAAGDSHAWDGSTANHIAPHALTPEELMRGKGVRQESGRRTIQKAALDGLLGDIPEDTASSSKKTYSDPHKTDNKRKVPEDHSPTKKIEYTAPKHSIKGETGEKSEKMPPRSKEFSNERIFKASEAKDILPAQDPLSEAPAPPGDGVLLSELAGPRVKRTRSHEDWNLNKDIDLDSPPPAGKQARKKISLPASGLDYSLPLSGDIGDYETTADAQTIRLELDHKKARLGLRMVITLILFFAAAALSVFDYFGYPISGVTPQVYLIMNAAILAIAAFVNITDILKIFRIFSVKADASAAASLTVIAAFVNTAVLFFSDTPPAGGYQLYTCVAMLALLFTVISEFINISRVRANFEIIANVDEKNAAFTMDDDFAQMLAGDDTLGETVICGSKKTVNVRGFLQNSFDDSPTDGICRALVPITLIAAVVSALAMAVISGSGTAAVTMFTAVVVMGAPFSSALLSAMQLGAASKKLREEYGVLAGYGAVDQYKDVNALMLDATDLFPSGSVQLHSIKNFGTVSVDRAILAAAAISVKCGGTLCDLFDSVIEGRRGMLPDVTSVRYESGLGIVGWVEEAEVKIGGREMMEHYAIPVPSITAEKKIRQRGARALYLSIGKDLAAMFIVSYEVDEDIRGYLSELTHKGVNLIIHTRDPLVTESMVGNAFHLPLGSVRVLDDETGKIYRAVSKPSVGYCSSIIGRGNVASVCHSLISCFKLYGNINFAKIAQLVSIIIAVAVVLFVSFTYGLSAFGGIHLLIYQLVWALIIVAGTSMRRV